MKKLLLLFAVLCLYVMPVHAQEVCDKSVAISIASGQTAELVALVSGDSIYVCGFILTADTIATTATFETGTGTTCNTGTTNLTGAMRLCDECQITMGSGRGILFRGLRSNALCLTTATGAVTGILLYAQY